MDKSFFSYNLLSLVASTIAFFSSLLAILLIIVRRKSNKSNQNRYDFKNSNVELEYMRQNLEREMYKVSRKLEENEARWKDINHLVINAQDRSLFNTENNSSTNTFLESLGISKLDVANVDLKQVFLLTPFNEDYNEEYKVVKATCEQLNLKCKRGDEDYVPSDIFTFVVKEIVKSNLIVANITGRNPNVLYELGIAHALGKKTIIISKNFTELPFDLRNYRILIYNSAEDLGILLRESLLNTILWRK